MAIVLQPKTDYKLLSEHHSNQDKLIVHVKLTDSCLRALQDYQNAKGVSRHKPTIKFSGQDGAIGIPVKKSTPDGDIREFRFGCSTLQSLGQGCLDCIQQSSTSHTLQSLGSITHKINVRATDDSYKMTRDKMKEAEEERKEVRTRVINMPSKGGKKRAVPKRTSMLMNMKRSMQNPAPKVSNGTSKSLRQGVIHLLAIRPYKKPELIDRLRKDGVNLKDRNSLTKILQQVASINNNQYTLMKHIYSEIQADVWPSYTDEERKLVQGKLQSPSEEQNNQINPVRTSPVKTRESTGTTTKSNKRPPPSSMPYSAPTTKKPRIAHINANNNITKESPEPYSPNNSITKHSPDATQEHKDENKAINTHKKRKTHTSPNEVLKVDEIDYKRKYLPIETYEQRISYKHDFQVEYEEYLQLKNKIDSVTKKFTELKGSLRRCPQDSQERQSIEEKIRRSYKKHQQDPSWERSKKRCQDLHTKLTYIKQLIREYDDKRTSEHNAELT